MNTPEVRTTLALPSPESSVRKVESGSGIGPLPDGHAGTRPRAGHGLNATDLLSQQVGHLLAQLTVVNFTGNPCQFEQGRVALLAKRQEGVGGHDSWKVTILDGEPDVTGTDLPGSQQGHQVGDSVTRVDEKAEAVLEMVQATFPFGFGVVSRDAVEQTFPPCG